MAAPHLQPTSSTLDPYDEPAAYRDEADGRT